jgi:hypothetical protein
VVSTSIDLQGPSLAPVVIGRRLEHLALVDSVASDSADAPTLDQAAEALARAGLVARVVSTSPARIVGGRRRIERDGLVVYEDAFSLWRGGSGAYYAGIAGQGNLGTRSGPGTLDDALTFLQREYEKASAPVR